MSDTDPNYLWRLAGKVWAEADDKIIRLDAVGVIYSALMAERKASLEDGYARGFAASGEGWNGEYPDLDFRENSYWVQSREEAVSRAIEAKEKIESGANAAADNPALSEAATRTTTTEGECK